MSAIRFIPARKSLWIRPDAWTSSSSAWPKHKRPKLPPLSPRRKRSSLFPSFRPQCLCTLRAVFFCLMDLKPHIEKFSKRFAEVENALSDPKLFDNPQRAQELSREYARLKELAAHG